MNKRRFDDGQLVVVKGFNMPMQISAFSEDNNDFYTVLPPFADFNYFSSMGFYGYEIKPLMHTVISKQND